MNKLVNILTLTIIVSACDTSLPKKTPHAFVPTFDYQDYSAINKCRILGPFAYNHDSIHIREYNIFDNDESKIGISQIESYRYEDSLLQKNLFFYTKENRISVDSISKVYEIGKDSSVFYYLSSNVYSKTDQRLILQIRSACAYKVWINGEPSVSDFDYRDGNQWAACELKSGNNHILVKMYLKTQWSDRKNILLHLAKEDFAKRDHYFRHSKHFLIDVLLGEGDDSLQIADSFGFGEDLTSIHVQDASGNLVRTSLKVSSNKKAFVKDLGPGVYNCQFEFMGRVYEQPFIIGSCDSLYRTLSEEISDYYLSSSQQPQLDMLNKRIQFLLDHKIKTEPTDQLFQVDFSEDGITWRKVLDGAIRESKNGASTFSLKNRKAQYARVIGMGNSYSEWNYFKKIHFHSGKGKANRSNRVPPSAVNTSLEGTKGRSAAKVFLTETRSKRFSFYGIGEFIEFSFDKNYQFTQLKIESTHYTPGQEKILDWKRKVVWPIFNLNKILVSLKTGQDPYKNKSGYAIRSYTSYIDDQPHYYLSIAPKRLKKEPLPVVFRAPTMQGNNYPFHHGWAMSNTDDLVKMELAASEYNVIFVIPWSTSYTKGVSEYSISNQEQVLADLQEDYSVDLDKVSVFGQCEGSTKAIQFAQYFPDRYASIGGIALTLIREMEPNGKVMTYNRLNNLQNSAIYMAHSNFDEHSPFDHLVEFSEKSEKKGIQTTHDIHIGATHKYYNDHCYDEMAQFFSTQKKERKPSKVNISTFDLKYGASDWLMLRAIDTQKGAKVKGTVSFNTISLTTNNVYELDILLGKLPYFRFLPIQVYANDSLLFRGWPETSTLSLKIKNIDPAKRLVKSKQTEGPMGDAFGRKFIIVRGTIGQGIKKKQTDLMADDLINFWKQRYFTHCLVKNDKDINDHDISTANLVLVGDTTTNQVFKKLSSELPVNLTKRNLTISGNTYEGDSLRFQMIYPNPDNPGNYIVLFSGNYLGDYQYGYNPFEKDDYDFRVVKIQADSAREIDKGFFNMYWETSN